MFPVEHRCTSNGSARAAQTDLSKHGLSPAIKSHIVCKHLTPFPQKNMIWVLVLRPKFDNCNLWTRVWQRTTIFCHNFFSIYRPFLSWLQIHQSGKQQIRTYIVGNTWMWSRRLFVFNVEMIFGTKMYVGGGLCKIRNLSVNACLTGMNLPVCTLVKCLYLAVLFFFLIPVHWIQHSFPPLK